VRAIGKEEDRRLRVLLHVDVECFHSRDESRTVRSQRRGRTVGTTYAPLACGKHAYDLVVLPPGIFLRNPVFVISPVGVVSNDVLVLLKDSVHGFVRVRLPQFSEGSIVIVSTGGNRFRHRSG